MSVDRPNRIDVAGLLAETDLAELVSRWVTLKRQGREYQGLCPFHDERSPSFTVNPAKGFFHCFGCGAHGDAISFVMRVTGREFREACEFLGAREAMPARTLVRRTPPAARPEGQWVPLMPVPDSAPPLVDARGFVQLFNPKSGKLWRFKPVRTDAYRDAQGRVLGYVLRNEFVDTETGKRRKITPQVTYCIAPDGELMWCSCFFPRLRPLLGLDALAARPTTPVLVVSGEKCRDVGARALPMFVVVSWPGGDNGVCHVDWRPLVGRDVVLWMDADESGAKAALGYTDHSGLVHHGIAQLLHAVGGASRLRMIDTTGKSGGWDCADAILDEGWTPRQLYAWARERVLDVEVQVDPTARAA